jgi:hypothetical protein
MFWNRGNISPPNFSDCFPAKLFGQFEKLFFHESLTGADVIMKWYRQKFLQDKFLKKVSQRAVFYQQIATKNSYTNFGENSN